MKLLNFLLLLTLPSWSNVKTDFELTKLGDPKSGYTLMVFGGIHGNEPGGYFAPAILAQFYEITKGALWVIPDINQKSITRFRRGVNGDMNRKFATIKKSDPDYATVMALKKLINHKDVDLILNLHDGHGYYRVQYYNKHFNPKAWGQSCVIDQLCISDENATFGKLGDIAAKVSKKLNKGLLAKHHTFGVKNTKTKKQDKAMQLSLTYYAITHNKPAFAIETSKNMRKIADKVFYQLRAIEAFMSIMGIEFKRKFAFTKAGVEKVVKQYGTIHINDDIKFNLSNLKPILRYVPMKEHNNSFKLSHPLADIVRRKTHYEVFVGHLRVVSLFKQTFGADCSLKEIDVVLDGKLTQQKVASTIMVDNNFSISLPDDYRVNVIGYTNKKHKNEKGITIAYKDMVRRFAIDKDRRRFRVEIYRGKHFCGMLIVNFRS
jgi:hypothetical protein